MRKNAWFKVLILGLVFSLLACTTSVYAQDTQEWEVSKSKIATELDNNNQTDVTLSLPSAEYVPQYHIEFVLDRTGSMENNIDAFTSLLDELANEIAGKDQVEILVGFIGCAALYDNETEAGVGARTLWAPTPIEQLDNTVLTANINDLLTDYTGTKQPKGSNLQSGIRAARLALEEDTVTPDKNKYLLFLTDGGIYTYSTDSGEVGSKAARNKAGQLWTTSNTDNSIRYNNGLLAYKETFDSNFENMFNYSYNNIGEYNYPKFGDSAEAKHDLPFSLFVDQSSLDPSDYVDAYAGWQHPSPEEYPYSALEKGTYMTAKELMDLHMEHNDYNIVCFGFYTYYPNLPGHYAVSTGFLDWVKNVGTVYKLENEDDTELLDEPFAEVKNDIIYALSEGRVIDIIGNDFDLVDASTIQLTRGGISLPSKIDDSDKNLVHFGTPESGVYPYSVQYIPGTPGNEKLVWDIRVPVENASRVTMSYKLELVNPPTDPGQYIFDTNESAILDYKDDNGNTGSETFEKPKVTYTVSVPDPVVPPTEPSTPTPTDPTNPPTSDIFPIGIVLLAVIVLGMCVGTKLISSRQ